MEGARTKGYPGAKSFIMRLLAHGSKDVPLGDQLALEKGCGSMRFDTASVFRSRLVGSPRLDVIGLNLIRKLSYLHLLIAFAGLGGVAKAQDSRALAQPEVEVTAPFQEEAVANVTAPCVQPAPMVRLEDYNGPFKKVVGEFARPLERKTVHPRHYKPEAKLCTLKLKDKFILFVQDSVDPVVFLGTAFDAGLAQAQDDDHSYGQGAKGYATRYGADFAGGTSSRFFKDFAYPWIFSEDPRYYRLGHGSGKRRFLHAVEHAVVAHRDDGRRMFNFSEWLGTTSSVVLSNTYHPDARRGVAATAERVAVSIVQDMGFDVLREFWPEISRKFRLPFRGEPGLAPASPEPSPATR